MFESGIGVHIFLSLYALQLHVITSKSVQNSVTHLLFRIEDAGALDGRLENV